MKIIVNSRTIFRFPTALVLNRLTLGFIRRQLRKNGVNLTKKQILALIKELKLYRKKYKNWNLIEAIDDGESLIINI